MLCLVSSYLRPPASLPGRCTIFHITSPSLGWSRNILTVFILDSSVSILKSLHTVYLTTLFSTSTFTRTSTPRLRYPSGERMTMRVIGKKDGRELWLKLDKLFFTASKNNSWTKPQHIYGHKKNLIMKAQWKKLQHVCLTCQDKAERYIWIFQW